MFLTKILEGAIYLSILYGIFNFLNIDEKINDFLKSHNVFAFLKSEINDMNSSNLEPDEIVEYYFDCIRSGKNEDANKVFTSDCDFQACTVEEYNKAVADIYYGFEEDLPIYPLFEEVRNFNYRILGVEMDESQGLAEVAIEIENCD